MVGDRVLVDKKEYCDKIREECESLCYGHHVNTPAGKEIYVKCISDCLEINGCS